MPHSPMAACRGATARGARARTTWRQRPGACRVFSQLVPRAAPDELNALISDLPHVQRFVHARQEPKTLLVEAASSTKRRPALRLFFEAADVALAEMMLDHNLAAPSPHQMGRAAFIDTLAAKCAKLVEIGQAHCVIVRREDAGFFSGFLCVLDALLFASPDAELLVDWRLDGSEGHFGYRPPSSEGDQCVWRSLFAPIHRPRRATEAPRHSEPPCVVCERWNMLLKPRFRWLARGSACEARQRSAYHAVCTEFVKPLHPAVVREVATLGARLAGGISLGVHKRVWNPGTAEYQGCRALPSCAGFVEATRRAIARLQARGQSVEHIYLATDDESAPAHFERAFGAKLIVRHGVTRASGGLNPDGTLNEVHVLSPHNAYGCGLGEAADVLTDALLLASCRALVHVDSNVTSAVSFWAPTLEMMHVVDLLAERPSPREPWLAPSAARLPAEFVQSGYLAGQRDRADCAPPMTAASKPTGGHGLPPRPPQSAHA